MPPIFFNTLKKNDLFYGILASKPSSHYKPDTMAEMNLPAKNLKGKGRMSTPKVDMTPMITFFMLTTSLAKRVSIPLAMPVPSDLPVKIPDNRSLTLCLGKDNLIQWYWGSEEKPLFKAKNASYAANGIREVLNNTKLQAIKTSGDAEKSIIVNIKPSDKSNYKNLIDILDELKIAGISTYFIVNISSHDLQRMKQSNAY